MPQRILIRRDTVANWIVSDPVLARGEITYAEDVNKFKVGNGMSSWSMLEYTDKITQATDTVLGGVRAKSKTTESVEVSLDTTTGKLFVPDQTYTLTLATESSLGGIKAKSKTYEPNEVAVDSETGIAYSANPSKGIYVALWEAPFVYPLDAVCYWQGKFYRSTVPNNVQNNPAGSVGFWENIKSGEGGGEGGVDLTYSIRSMAIESVPNRIEVEDRVSYDEVPPVVKIYQGYYTSMEEITPSMLIMAEDRVISNIVV